MKTDNFIEISQLFFCAELVHCFDFLIGNFFQGKTDMAADIFLHPCWGIQIRLESGDNHCRAFAVGQFGCVCHARSGGIACNNYEIGVARAGSRHVS